MIDTENQWTKFGTGCFGMSIIAIESYNCNGKSLDTLGSHLVL
jgi:hypothetical protein